MHARLTSYDKLFRLRIGVVTWLRDYYWTNVMYVVASPRRKTADNKTGQLRTRGFECINNVLSWIIRRDFNRIFIILNDNKYEC